MNGFKLVQTISTLLRIPETPKRSGQSKSEVVRQALKRQLTIESFQQLRKELLPYGEAKGWLTDEDVFREVS